MKNQTILFVFLSLLAAVIILSINAETTKAAVPNCTQNWTLNDTWSQCINFTHTKNYYDLNECDNLTGKPADITEPCGAVLDCILPINGTHYNVRRIEAKINNTKNINLKHIKYSIDGSYWRSLCNNCSYWFGNISYSEGTHELSIKTITYLDEDEDYCNATITVDSKYPYIVTQSPLSGKYTTGLFSVMYNEVNLDKVQLYYKGVNESNYQIEDFNNCEAGLKKICEQNVDLSAYHNQQIDYFFNISDVLRSKTSDTIYTVMVDTEKPVITVDSPIRNGNYSKVPLTIDLNGEKVYSLQYSDNGLPFRTICRRCDSYNRTRTFRNGVHNLTIRAVDYAGNEETFNVTFLVDSKRPRIMRQYPRSGRYTNGMFTVRYTEDNVVKTTLYYTDNISNGYLTKEGDCESGKNKECSISVNLSAYDGKTLYYYFNITDPVTSYWRKRPYTVYADFTPPQIEIISPEPNTTYNSRYILFHINMTEKVKYLYYAEDNVTFKRLCARCSLYYRKRPLLRKEEYNLVFKAVDDAGNEAYAYQDFVVDY